MEKQITVKTMVGLFFLLLFVGLFLGDGKQSVIEPFWMAGVLILWGLAQVKGITMRRPPRPIAIAWALVLGTQLLSSINSDSLGYSISALSRLIMAYLVYALFYSFASTTVISMFVKSLLGLTATATLAASIIAAFPVLWRALPSMNLLYFTYGHNHLANILIFVVPMVFTGVLPQPANPFVIVVFLVALVLTFARGAWLLVAAYLLWLWIFASRRRFSWVIVAATIGAAFGASVLLSTRQTTPPSTSILPAPIQRFVFKPSPTQNRSRYWRQAMVAFTKRPWFGSGPGTFILQSKELQESPSSYSWFAHSFPLQTLVEVGAVGALPVFILLWLNWWKIARYLIQRGVSAPGAAHSLFWAITLTALYSMYEFNLDFLVVWLLLWAALGALFGVVSPPSPTHNTSRAPRGWLTALALLYITWTASQVAAVVSKQNQPAFFLAPFDTVRVIAYLSDRNPPEYGTITGAAQELTLLFHRRDPDVLFALAKRLMAEGDNNRANAFFAAALALDPQNDQHHKEYLSFLVEHGSDEQIVDYIERACDILTGGRTECSLTQTTAETAIVASAARRYVVVVDETPKFKEGIQKLLYLIGLDFVITESAVTRELWRVARDIFPNWGYYHVELASLEYRGLHDSAAAQETLTACRGVIYTAFWCGMLAQDLEQLPRVGSLEQNIRAIPEILP